MVLFLLLTWTAGVASDRHRLVQRTLEPRAPSSLALPLFSFPPWVCELLLNLSFPFSFFFSLIYVGTGTPGNLIPPRTARASLFTSSFLFRVLSKTTHSFTFFPRMGNMPAALLPSSFPTLPRGLLVPFSPHQANTLHAQPSRIFLSFTR